MKDHLLPFVLLCSTLAHAQSPEGYELIIDPAGADSVVVFADGLVTGDGGALVLGGYDETQEAAFSLCAYDGTGQFIWGRKVAATSSGTQMVPRKLVRMSGGELIVFGNWATGGAQAYFVTRLDTAGQVQWTRTYRQELTGFDYGFSSIVATSDDELVVSMGLIDRTVAMRLDIDGNLLWANRYVTDLSPTDKNPGFDFTATADGGVLLTEKAEDDIFLVRLLADGSVDWAKRYPNGGYCHTRAAILLADGGFLIAGSRDTSPFAARLDATGNMIWQKEYVFDEGIMEAFDEAMELPDGDYILTPSRGSAGIMALRATPLGSPVSAKTIGGSGYTEVIGQHEDLMVFGGRAWLTGPGGLEDAMLLLSSTASLGMDCMPGTTGVTAIDIAIPEPIYGCDVVMEPIVQDSALTFTTNVLFGARPLCASTSAIPEPHAAEMFVFPSPVARGEAVLLDIRGAVSIRCLAADGRVMEDLMIGRTTASLRFSTTDLPTGLYLLRAADVSGRVLATGRLVVE